MEPVFILSTVCLFILAAIAAVMIVEWAIRRITKRIFMVDDLNEYGGSITMQGIEYHISRDAKLYVRHHALVAVEPDGRVRKFESGPFVQPPTVTLNCAPGWEE